MVHGSADDLLYQIFLVVVLEGRPPHAAGIGNSVLFFQQLLTRLTGGSAAVFHEIMFFMIVAIRAQVVQNGPKHDARRRGANWKLISKLKPDPTPTCTPGGRRAGAGGAKDHPRVPGPHRSPAQGRWGSLHRCRCAKPTCPKQKMHSTKQCKIKVRLLLCWRTHNL